MKTRLAWVLENGTNKFNHQTFKGLATEAVFLVMCDPSMHEL